MIVIALLIAILFWLHRILRVAETITRNQWVTIQLLGKAHGIPVHRVK